MGSRHEDDVPLKINQNAFAPGTTGGTAPVPSTRVNALAYVLP